MAFTILHVSDVHFGVNSDNGEQARLVRALIDAAHKDSWTPDLCVFSGDLANWGLDEQFRDAGHWLSELVGEPWRCPLFIVPGNHDVDRKQFPLSVATAHESQERYDAVRAVLDKHAAHLTSFSRWHEAFRTSEPLLVSDWTSPFGCHAILRKNGIKVHVVGLNTALLSKDDNDQGKLVQDARSLNESLEKRSEESECMIAIGHHPLSWLSDWNGRYIKELLSQKSGAHLYLHGHQHEQSVATIGSSTGAALTTLECGAAYAGSAFPQFFTFYQLDFIRREVTSKVYRFSENAGEWVLDATQQPIVCRIPFVSSIPPRSAPLAVIEPAAGHEAFSEEAPPGPPRQKVAMTDDNSLSDSRDQIELEVRRQIDEARTANQLLRQLFSNQPFLKDNLFSSDSRIKSLETATAKVLRKRELRPNFAASDLSDMCGFRFVTRFQSSIPEIVTGLLKLADEIPDRIRINLSDGATIHTSRHDNDPLSIVGSVADAINAADHAYKVEIRSSATGYSSVHIILDVNIAVPGNGTAPHWARVEIQIRSILEEIWGQLDHGFRYETDRGGINSARWQLHLNVLKAHFDACAQHLDLIKEIVASETDAPAPSKNSRKTISRPDQIVDLCRTFLPPQLCARIEEAFKLWKIADASKDRGRDPGLYHRAADAFAALIGRPSDLELAPDALDRFIYLAKMERAYLLTAADDAEDNKVAEQLYREILADRPEDAAALFRLGQILRSRGLLEDAIEHLDKAIARTRDAGTTEFYPGERAFVYDRARVQRANALFRKFERLKVEADGRGGHIPERLNLISQAIRQAREVMENHETDIGGLAKNDLLYYAWEEFNLLGESGKSKATFDEEHFRKLCDLIAAQQERTPYPYEYDDTLARAHKLLKDMGKAQKAAMRVCDSLERVAEARSRRPLGGGYERLSFQWVSQLSPFLDTDQQDALAFALDLLRDGK